MDLLSAGLLRAILTIVGGKRNLIWGYPGFVQQQNLGFVRNPLQEAQELVRVGNNGWCFHRAQRTQGAYIRPNGEFSQVDALSTHCNGVDFPKASTFCVQLFCARRRQSSTRENTPGFHHLLGAQQPKEVFITHPLWPCNRTGRRFTSNHGWRSQALSHNKDSTLCRGSSTANVMGRTPFFLAPPNFLFILRGGAPASLYRPTNGRPLVS